MTVPQKNKKFRIKIIDVNKARYTTKLLNEIKF